MGNSDPWTQFWDMHSGGGLKVEPYHYIYIEASRDTAISEFERRFERDPNNITCQCCGPDYTIEESPSLKQATGYHRNCRHLKTPKDEDGRYMNGLPEIQNNYYLEPGEEPPDGFEVDNERPPIGEYIPLEEFVERDDVLVIPRDDVEA